MEGVSYETETQSGVTDKGGRITSYNVCYTKLLRRSGHLETAQQIILKYRDRETPVGIVTGAMRENQRIQLTTLEKLHEADVDMQTTVFVGNSATFTYDGFMITPRGYAEKYRLEDAESAGVITSYSIHYTKLYEWSLRIHDVKSGSGRIHS